MILEITQQEAQVLVNLLDVAVKATGLGACQAALFFQNKIQEAAKNESNVISIKQEEKAIQAI